MKLVVLTSPVFVDVNYARACVKDSLKRGEAPLLFCPTGEGEAGYAWLSAADELVVCIDRGISASMGQVIAKAESLGKPVIYRSIGWEK